MLIRWLRALRHRPCDDDDGRRGERIAERHLVASGMRIRARRFRVRGGELDLVADDAGTLVFIEVKTTRNETHDPAERITATKRRRLIRGAKAFVRRHGRESAACRFDVVLVYLDPAGRPRTVAHVEAAFVPRDWGV